MLVQNTLRTCEVKLKKEKKSVKTFAVDENKGQFKSSVSSHTCATRSRLPSYISDMSGSNNLADFNILKVNIDKCISIIRLKEKREREKKRER